MLIAPINHADILQGILISRGIDPRKGLKGAPVKPSVKVVGGQATPELIAAGQAWGEANAAANWAKTTGSSRAAIDFWTDPEK